MPSSSKVVVPFCIPTSKKWESLALHILASSWSCRCFGFGPFLQMCSDISLFYFIYNFLITNNVEHLFVCVFASSMSSLVRCLSPVFDLLALFLIVAFKDSFYILYTNYLSDMFLEIYSLTLWLIFLEVFNLWRLAFHFFSLLDPALCLRCKKSLPLQRHLDFLPCCLLGML